MILNQDQIAKLKHLSKEVFGGSATLTTYGQALDGSQFAPLDFMFEASERPPDASQQRSIEGATSIVDGHAVKIWFVPRSDRRVVNRSAYADGDAL